MITQRIDSISIKLHVHVYGSKAFIIHKEIIIKQTLTYMESICLLLSVYTTYFIPWSGTNFVLRHKYDAAKEGRPNRCLQQACL